MADQAQNRQVIQLLGEDYGVGRVPLKGERNKMITLCTSTAYYGCDFWSEEAVTVVVSKCRGRQQHMMVDIATQLVQITGRQRNTRNPFRNQIIFVYDDFKGEEKIDDAMLKQERKIALTERMNAFLNTAPEELKMTLGEILQGENKAGHYHVSYSRLNTESMEFEENQFARLFEEYQAHVQYEIFNSGAMVFKEIDA